jgi:YfiR/HmsC-like
VRAGVRSLRLGLCAAMVVALFLQATAAADLAAEYQVKAVFVFNFSHFVDWPAQSFTTPNEPFVIGVLGGDPFGARLDEAVRGERVTEHPLIVRRFRSIDEIGECQILFIDRSEAEQLDRIISALHHRGVLTVSEIDQAAQHGVMIQFATENNHIRLKINLDSVHAAGLSISSKLLRLADVISTGPGG